MQVARSAGQSSSDSATMAPQGRQTGLADSTQTVQQMSCAEKLAGFFLTIFLVVLLPFQETLLDKTYKYMYFY